MADSPLVARLYRDSGAERWGLSSDAFSRLLDGSAAHAFDGRTPSQGDFERYVAALHVEDLALAGACAAGNDAAWEHFIREHRPGLYRAADAIDPSGGARDLADSLYGELFGLAEREGARQSLFRYFQGRSRLGTWLRAVLAQRHVDRVRARRRLDPLPEDDGPAGIPMPGGNPDPERPRLVAAVEEALASSVAALAPRDRLRLSCYYVQNMKLAAIGRMLKEHEATVSRHLARTRTDVREAVDARLRTKHGFDDAAVQQCFAVILEDPGQLDLVEVIGPAPAARTAAGIVQK